VKGTGCDNGNNGEYAHVCNFEKAPGVYCLQAHSSREWCTEAARLGEFYQTITVGSSCASFNVSFRDRISFIRVITYSIKRFTHLVQGLLMRFSFHETPGREL
jgi:hypothetical protein